MRRSPDALWRTGERFLVLAHSDGDVLTADGPAADIWAALATDVDLDELVVRLAAHYGIEPAMIRDDIGDFVDQLRQRGFVVGG